VVISGGEQCNALQVDILVSVVTGCCLDVTFLVLIDDKDVFVWEIGGGLESLNVAAVLFFSFIVSR
jgi:hypothetical protein